MVETNNIYIAENILCTQSCQCYHTRKIVLRKILAEVTIGYGSTLYTYVLNSGGIFLSLEVFFLEIRITLKHTHSALTERFRHISPNKC